MESAQNCIEDCEKDIALKDLERKKNKTKTKTFHVCVPWSSNCEVSWVAYSEQLAYLSSIPKFHGAVAFLGCPTNASPQESQPQAKGLQLSEGAEQRQREGPTVTLLGRWHLETCHPENSNREPTKATEEEVAVTYPVKPKDWHPLSYSFSKSPRTGRERDQKSAARFEEQPCSSSLLGSWLMVAGAGRRAGSGLYIRFKI